METKNYISLSILFHILTWIALWLFVIAPNFYIGLSIIDYALFYSIIIVEILLQLLMGFKWYRKQPNRIVKYLPLIIPLFFYGILKVGNLL